VNGHLGLLGGMVRANRPWRTILELSRALVVALSTAAFALITSTIWQLGDALGALRLSALSVLTLAAMVVWLIVVQDLWERPSGGLDRSRPSCSTPRPCSRWSSGRCAWTPGGSAGHCSWRGSSFGGDVLQGTIGDPVGLGDYAGARMVHELARHDRGHARHGLGGPVDVREAAYSYHPERRRRRERDDDPG
jgi:hypothetical protein